MPIAGWNTVGDRKMYFRSLFEWRWARYLELLKQSGHIRDWLYEPETFWFYGIKRGVRSYLPDFRIYEIDGGIYYQECKGYLDGKSITKMKRLIKYYARTRLQLVMLQVTDKNRAALMKMEYLLDRIIDGGKILKQAGIK